MRTYRLVLLVVLLACSGVRAAGQSVRLERWDFRTDPSGTLSIGQLSAAAGWRAARAGLSWNAQFDDLRNYMGYAWYRATVQVPDFADKRRVLLRFGAVDYRTWVYVNGKQVGEHDGGYTPFVFDITDRVRRGANEIAVRVLDPPDKGITDGLRYSEIPHGKQSWYVQTGGMWQPVTLEFRPATYIERVQVTPEVDGHVHIEVAVAGERASSGPLSLTVRDRHGATVLTKRVPLNGQTDYKIADQIASPELWSPDDPALYTLDAALGDDSYHTRFGFRRLEAREGKLFLNGKPFFMMGALDQDFYPYTIYSPPSAAYIRREMEAGRKLGLNTLRCHIKVCEPKYLEAADEVGMLVWYEIPNWDHFSAASAERGEKTLEAMVARDWNHPAIVIQSIINESWGIDLKQADQRKWLAGMYERAHSLVAPLGRLIVDNSACCENFHVRSDLNDFHQYYSIPDHAAQWDRWVADFASNPKWTFSTYGDAQRSGSEPLIVSEFGNWGVPQLPAALPWWFHRDKGDEITQPAGVQERFHQYRLDRIFADYNALARATQWHEFLSLKHEIEEIRRHASIQGYVITEFTDLNWESNGLLTMWRDPKVYADELRQIQQPDVILAHFDRHVLAAGEVARASVVLSHFSARDLKNATVYWWTDTGASGHLSMSGDPAPQSAMTLGDIAIPTSATARPGIATTHLFLELRDAEGVRLAQNQYAIHVITPAKIGHVEVALYDPAGTLPQVAAALVAHGYVLNNAAPVMLATRWDDHVSQFVEHGGHAVVLADAADALPATFAVKMQERKGDYDGNWISNFAWILPQSPVFRALAVGPILGWEAEAVTPRFVLA
jgi:hypothetical protein